MKIAKTTSKFQKKNLEAFISKWIRNSKKEVRENFSRMKDDVDVEEYISIFQGKQGPLTKLIHEKEGRWYFRKTKGENQITEFKDSFFANQDRVKEDWDDVKNNAKGKKSLPKDLEEWMKIKDNDVQFGILKCVCSFLNTKGGKIWLGVNNDDGKIIGISNVKKRKQFIKDDGTLMDDFQIIDVLSTTINQELENNFPHHCNSHIDTKLVDAPDDQHLLLIDVQPAYPADVLMVKDGREIPFVRVGSMCKPYPYQRFLEYSKKRGDEDPKKKKS